MFHSRPAEQEMLAVNMMSARDGTLTCDRPAITRHSTWIAAGATEAAVPVHRPLTCSEAACFHICLCTACSRSCVPGSPPPMHHPCREIGDKGADQRRPPTLFLHGVPSASWSFVRVPNLYPSPRPDTLLVTQP